MPRVGKHYAEGFRNLRTLVVGVTHICTNSCPFHDRCTSVEGIKTMDKECPCYKQREDYYRLSNSNEIEISSFIYGEARYPAYSAFTYYMTKAADEMTSEHKKELWEHVAFTNYLQIFHDNDKSLPADEQLYTDSFPAFLQVLEELKPHVIYVWNPRVCEVLKKHPDLLRYLGKANMNYGLSVYAFTYLPVAKEIPDSDLRRIRYTYGIKTTIHHQEWFKNQVRESLSPYMETDEDQQNRLIRKLGDNLYDMVDSDLLGTTEDSIYFNNSFYGKWTTKHKGYFFHFLKEEYLLKIGGANEAIAKMFDEKNIAKYSYYTEECAKKDKLCITITKTCFPKLADKWRHQEITPYK